MKKAIIAGATGLIGNQVTGLLLKDASYAEVILLVRKDPGLKHDKLKVVITDFNDLEKHSLRADDVYCCLGTTMKQAGSKEAFMQVDYEYPVRLAEITKAQGASCFLLISALGADVHSAIFYNQVKGKVEARIQEIGFQVTHVFRPSLLLGARNVKRSGEDAAKFFYKYFGFLIPRKYKAIESETVARAMVKSASKISRPGFYIHESVDIATIF